MLSKNASQQSPQKGAKMISQRMKDLLVKASACFSEGFSPFNNDWLSENQVTLDECMSLSELIGTVIKGVALSDDSIQSIVFMVGASDGYINSALARVSIDEVRLQKKLRANKRLQSDASPQGASK